MDEMKNMNVLKEAAIKAAQQEILNSTRLSAINKEWDDHTQTPHEERIWNR